MLLSNMSNYYIINNTNNQNYTKMYSCHIEIRTLTKRTKIFCATITPYGNKKIICIITTEMIKKTNMCEIQLTYLEKLNCMSNYKNS